MTGKLERGKLRKNDRLKSVGLLDSLPLTVTSLIFLIFILIYIRLIVKAIISEYLEIFSLKFYFSKIC